MYSGNLRKHLNEIMKKQLQSLEKYLKSDILVIFSEIYFGLEERVKECVENLKQNGSKYDNIFIILTTTGGSLNPLERIVNILRKFYKEVNFIVPDFAYSAGTVLCMSGDKIYMNYHSVLGPTDPQVQNRDGKFVPALGYLNKVEELIEKSKENTITSAELAMLLQLDIGEMRQYEQERELAIDMLQKWLTTYKFKTWEKHRDGRKVTEEDKRKRAIEIAEKLSDNKRWKSHARPINMKILRDELRLQIEDFDDDEKLKNFIEQYYDNLKEYMAMNKFQSFIQTRILI